MRYLSLFSGIEAASIAWKPLGWTPVAFAEIEKFPSAVLAHHYPDVPNLGDVTKHKEWPDLGPVDLICGGSPCQSFSVAGLRKGMDDPRGNMALVFLAIIDRVRPTWVVFENVPGLLSSNEGRDFGAFLGGLGELGYGFAYRVLDAQFVRVDGFERAVPQRRRRVFVVGYLGDWRRAAAVLFEREGMFGDSAPRRQAGQAVAPTISARPTGGGGLGTDFDCDGGLIPFGGNNTAGPIDVSTAVNARGGPHGRLDFESETFVATRPVAATLTRGAESSGKGGYAGRRQEDDDNLVATPYTLAIRGRDGAPDLEYRQDGTANAILTPNGGRAGIGVGAIAFDTTQITSAANYSSPQPGDPCHPLAAGAHAPAIAIQAGAMRENPASGPDGIGVQEGIAYTVEARAEVQAVAWSIMPQNSGKDYKARAVDVAQPIMAGGPVGGNQGGDYIQQQWAVRRLTPVECERLQGFPEVRNCFIIRVCRNLSDQQKTDAHAALLCRKSQSNASTADARELTQFANAADKDSSTRLRDLASRAVVSVQIDLERGVVRLHSPEKSHSSAVDADERKLFPLPTGIENFARLAALLTRAWEMATLVGRAASQANTLPSTTAWIGSGIALVSGREIAERASDAEKSLNIAKTLSTSTILDAGQTSPNFASTLETLSCCVAHAIDGFIPPKILETNSYDIALTTSCGFTNIPWRGKPEAPDGPRYKALGNSMACNVMRWIGRRIDHVEAISAEMRRAAA